MLQLAGRLYAPRRSYLSFDRHAVLENLPLIGMHSTFGCELEFIQAFSFLSLLQLRLRIEVPLWRDLTTAKHPTADLPAEEDSASDASGSAERSPRLALLVPVGLAEPPEVGTEETTEDEDTAAEPNYAFAKGYGRFGIGYTRLATALGNFEQGNIEAESAVAAQWLTSGLRVAMSRTGWHLLSPALC